MAFFLQQESEPSLGQLLGQLAGGGIKTGSSYLAQRQQQRAQQALQQQLESAGIPPQLAELFGQVPTGAQTEIVRKGLELGERKALPEDSFVEEAFMEDIPAPPSPDRGLTLKERTKRQESRYGKNIEATTAAKNKLNSLEQEGMSLDQLEKLNESGELPSGLGRFNVNLESGELRAPFLAAPEAELFVKTVNDFTTKAKDSFGARVTNFELNRFLKRLPTLLNSEEGREAILRQMKIINQLNQLDESSLLQAFEKAGGARNIDLDQAERYAGRLAKEKKDELIKEYRDLDKVFRPKKARGLRRAKEGEKLTESMIDKLLERSGNDPEKAEKLARDLGYEF